MCFCWWAWTRLEMTLHIRIPSWKLLDWTRFWCWFRSLSSTALTVFRIIHFLLLSSFTREKRSSSFRGLGSQRWTHLRTEIHAVWVELERRGSGPALVSMSRLLRSLSWGNEVSRVLLNRSVGLLLWVQTLFRRRVDYISLVLYRLTMILSQSLVVSVFKEGPVDLGRAKVFVGILLSLSLV